jgi:hypothetical protein
MLKGAGAGGAGGGGCRPLPLELSAADEATVRAHLHVFRLNGFECVLDDDAPAGRRVCLATIPYSRSAAFGVRGTWAASLLHARRRLRTCLLCLSVCVGGWPRQMWRSWWAWWGSGRARRCGARGCARCTRPMRAASRS